MAMAAAQATTTINPPRRKSSGPKRPAAAAPADDSDSDGATAAKRTKNGDGGAPEHSHSDVASLSWSVEELGQLVSNLAQCLPANDLVKYTTMVEKVDWEKVRFGSHTAAECKEKWAQLMQKLRRYRTLTDLVGDAREWLKRPWLPGNGTARRQRHPGLPKKPLTPYFRYFQEKREKYARENPELSMTELAKLLSNKFQELPEKKKQKYKESFERENNIYKMELKKFKKENPDMFPEPAGKQPSPPVPLSAPEKPQTPIQLFTLDRLKKPEFAKLDKKEAQEEIRKQWAELSDGKRIKWIRRALQDKQRYEMEVAEYTQAYPGFKAAAVKPILSKAEQEFKDKCDGKPERPPNSGYSLFSRIMLRQLKNVPAKEKMAEISQLWKNLTQQERDSYNKQATKANAKYKEKYAAYLSNLPEEERQKVEAEAATHKSATSAGGGTAAKGNSKGSNAVATSKGGARSVAPGDENRPPAGERPKPKKPLSAMFFFQQEKLAAMKERCPQMSHQEVMRALAREFSELPERKKEKYKKMATEAKEKAIEETNGHKVSKEEKVHQTPSMPSLNRRNRLFKGEPKKPPQSGYGVFSTEMLSQLVDVDPKNRMAEIAKRWNAMPDSDKERYKRSVQDLQRKYNKELTRFLEGLSPEDRLEYDARRARMKAKRKGGAIKAAATRKEKRRKAAAAADDAKVKEEDASSEESSSEESSDEDEDDDEEEEEEEEDGDEEGGGGKQVKSEEDDSDSSSEEEEEEESESGSSDSSSSEDSDEPSAPTLPTTVPKQPPAAILKKQQIPIIKKEEAPSLPTAAAAPAPAVVKVEPTVNHEEEEEDDSSESDSDTSSDSSDDDDDDSDSGSDSKD